MPKLTFGQKLMILRKNKGLSQKKLAEVLQVGVANIARYETGVTFPHVPTLILLSDYFEVSIDYLLKDDDDFYRAIPNDKNLLKVLEEIRHVPQSEIPFLCNMFKTIIESAIHKANQKK